MVSPSPVPVGSQNEPPQTLPSKFVRVGRRGKTWGLPRRFSGYEAADYSELSVRGAAPKIIIRKCGDPNNWYMAKGPENWGQNETYTEFLINQLGQRLEFPMAHSGLIRVDGELRFASANFRKPDESLTHGSVMFQACFGDDLETVGKNPWDEQRTYDVELIHDVMKGFCSAESFQTCFASFVQMLVFDALTGSNDRHMQNWGVLATTTNPRSYRFAPIFDSARALLWDYDEGRLEKLSKNNSQIIGYVNRARPKVGSAKFGRAINHFRLVRYLYEQYPEPTAAALTKVTMRKVKKAIKILREYPFCLVFSRVRRDTMSKIIAIRARALDRVIAGKGDPNADTMDLAA
jgi:hypothetical protein